MIVSVLWITGEEQFSYTVSTNFCIFSNEQL